MKQYTVIEIGDDKFTTGKKVKVTTKCGSIIVGFLVGALRDYIKVLPLYTNPNYSGGVITILEHHIKEIAYLESPE